MNCKDISKDIQAWIDGELSPSHAEELTAHLTLCAACRNQERLLRAMSSAIPPPRPVSSGFTQAVMVRISKEKEPALEAGEPWWSLLFGKHPQMGVTALATASIVLILGGIVTMRHIRHPPLISIQEQAQIPLDRCLAANCQG